MIVLSPSPLVQSISFRFQTFYSEINKKRHELLWKTAFKMPLRTFNTKIASIPLHEYSQNFCPSLPAVWMERNPIAEASEDSSPSLSWVRLVDFRIISCFFVWDLQHPHPSLIDFPLIFASRRLISFHFNILLRKRKQIPTKYFQKKRNKMKWNEWMQGKLHIPVILIYQSG